MLSGSSFYTARRPNTFGDLDIMFVPEMGIKDMIDFSDPNTKLRVDLMPLHCHHNTEVSVLNANTRDSI